MELNHNTKLLWEVRDAACNCDAMLGWTCSFCKRTLPKLERALSSSKVGRMGKIDE
jgi:hypothetical protein